jgi:uridine kinase
MTTKVYNSDTGKADIKKTFDLSKKIMVIEGIFLFHPKLIGDIFDLKIFIDGDVEAADQRRIKREKARWGKDYFPHDHPDSYFRLVKIAFERYYKLYNPKKLADIVVDFRDNFGD